MELITKVALIKDLENIDIFQIQVNNLKYPIVKKKLLEQKDIATQITKDLFEAGEITSVSRPVNRKIQKDLDKLGIAKRIIKKSLKELNEFFK